MHQVRLSQATFLPSFLHLESAACPCLLTPFLPLPLTPWQNQELVMIAGQSAGIVLLAPPSDSAEARAAVSTLLPALKKQKASGWRGLGGGGLAARQSLGRTGAPRAPRHAAPSDVTRSSPPCLPCAPAFHPLWCFWPMPQLSTPFGAAGPCPSFPTPLVLLSQSHGVRKEPADSWCNATQSSSLCGLSCFPGAAGGKLRRP